MDNHNSLSNLPLKLILGLVFLLPLFFVPVLPISLVFSKSLLVTIAGLLAFLAIVVGYLRSGRIDLPRSWILLSVAVLAVAYLLSTLFSGTLAVSLFGYGFEVETFFAIATFALILFATAMSLRKQDDILYVYLALIASFLVIALYQVIRLFAPIDFLTFSQFSGKTANLIGKWSDVGVFSGLVLIISLTSLEFLKFAKPLKIALYVSVGLSLFFLALVNFFAVWLVVALLSLLLFIFSVFSGYQTDPQNRKFSYLTLGVMVISLIFMLGGNQINNALSSAFRMGGVEARPSLQSTMVVAKESLKENPVLGVGPNRFSTEWLRSKPVEINNSFFWDTDFNFGVGLIPTALVTVGLLGFLAWLFFLGSIGLEGLRALYLSMRDPEWGYSSFSSLVAALYLWIMAIIYPPSMVILALAFIFTGTFVAAGLGMGSIRRFTFAFSENTKHSFLSVFALVVISVLFLVGGYQQMENLAAHYNFQKGLRTVLASGDIEGAESSIFRAVMLSGKDAYLRSLSELQIMKLERLLQREDIEPEAARTEFQEILGAAISTARAAIEYDSSNYLNWLSLGRVYEAVVPLQIEGAYEEAVLTYEEALARNPKNPAILLIMARLEAGNGDMTKARELIARSLSLKNNYTEAIFLLSQIEVSEGNIEEAIESVESAALISPHDPIVFFQLGFLKYTNKDYRGAITALERAVILNQVYANAKYFLGLSYEAVDRTDDAIAQFEDIQFLNPDNQEIKLILSNLKAGRDPFSGATPPVTSAPEERETLPIEE
jgi:tetratricopeptide (TPR) repeat protein